MIDINIFWGKDCHAMADYFPQFRPFSRNGVIGFRGYLRGKRTGTIYLVLMQTPVSVYPTYPPDIDIHPWIG